MKSIMISIRPEWVAKIANGIKSIEVRRSAPKDWKDYLSGKTKIEPKPRTAFIYCTKEMDLFKFSWGHNTWYESFKSIKDICADQLHALASDNLNGKVVGKFRLEKVDCLRFGWERNPYFSGIGSATRLSVEETKEYLNGKTGYLWHISDLEIFDEPKELGEFSYLVRKFHVDGFVVPLYGKVTKAPQSWQYVEVKE